MQLMKIPALRSGEPSKVENTNAERKHRDLLEKPAGSAPAQRKLEMGDDALEHRRFGAVPVLNQSSQLQYSGGL